MFRSSRVVPVRCPYRRPRTETIDQGRRPLAKKPNYDFERRRKEQDRKQKKEAKREERLQRKRDGLANPDDDAPEGVESDDEAAPQADGEP